MVYIREAHSTDGWAVEHSGWSIVADAQNTGERNAAAAQACTMLKLPFPIVVDTMDDAVAWRWSAWPERLFVVDAAGRVAYVGEQGPWGFWPTAASEPYGWGGEHGFDHGLPLDTFLEELLAAETR
jgi:hypothetical protein